MWYIYTHIGKHPYVHREGMWVPGTHMVHILHTDKHLYMPREWGCGCQAHMWYTYIYARNHPYTH